MRTDVYKHFLDSDMAFFEKHKTGELMSRLGQDIFTAKQTATGNISTLIKSLLHCVTDMCMLFAISWRLTLTILLIIPIYACISHAYSRI